MCFATTHMLIKSSIWTWCFSDSGRNGLLNPMLPNNVAVAFSYSKFSSGPYFVDPTITNSETTYRPLLKRDINLLKQYLPWKFKVEKLLGQILRLRHRLCSEWHEEGGHAAENENSSNGIGTWKIWINLICKSFSKILRLNEIFAIHWILSWMKWT